MAVFALNSRAADLAEIPPWKSVADLGGDPRRSDYGNFDPAIRRFRPLPVVGAAIAIHDLGVSAR